MIQLQPEIGIDIIRKQYVIGFNCAGISNISFRKHINRFNLSRNKVEYFATEVYSGAYGVYNDFRLDIGFRVFHWKYRDDAIANNGLNPDRHNPYKIRVLLSYVFWQK